MKSHTKPARKALKAYAKKSSSIKGIKRKEALKIGKAFGVGHAYNEMGHRKHKNTKDMSGHLDMHHHRRGHE